MDLSIELSLQAYCKMSMHSMKYPYATCTGFFLSPANGEGDKDSKLRIVETIPVTHTSHYSAPNIEIALNAVKAFAIEQELVISGYYHIGTTGDDASSPDLYAQRVCEKISETFPNPILCIVSPTSLKLLPHQYIDGKWRVKSTHTITIESNSDSIIHSKDKLHRDIVDFDEHLDNISLDWTNQKIAQKIDLLSASIC